MPPKVPQKRTTKKLLRQLSNQDINDNDNDSYDEVDFQVAYRRPKIIHDDADAPLSDYVLARLAKARELAMEKYREVWG